MEKNILAETIEMTKSVSNKHLFKQGEYEICSYEDVFCGEKFFNVSVYKNDLEIMHFTTKKLLTTDEELSNALGYESLCR